MPKKESKKLLAATVLIAVLNLFAALPSSINSTYDIIKKQRKVVAGGMASSSLIKKIQGWLK